MARFFVSESARRYASISFFSVLVTFMLVLALLGVFAFFAVVVVFFAAVVVFFVDVEVFFAVPLSSLAALMRDACVTPVALAMALSCACVRSFSPRSARLMSLAETPLTRLRQIRLRAGCLDELTNFLSHADPSICTD